MHELSIAMSLVETAARQAESQGYHGVRKVSLRLGALAGVEPESLSFCFPLAAKDTICEGAELELTFVPGSGVCGSCGSRSEVTDLLAPCPSCGGWPLAVEGGREMQLESMEVV